MAAKALNLSQNILAQIVRLGISRSFLIKSLPYLAIITAHSIWGIHFVVAKLTLQEIPPMSLAFLRFVLAFILLSPFLILESKKLKIAKEDLPKLIAVGVFMVTLNISFFFEGLTRTTATSASVLTMTVPVLSVLLGWWFLKEKVYVVNLAGLSLGFIGTVLTIGLPLIILGLQSANEILLGNFLIIIASICWVIGAIISKDMLKKYSTLLVTAIIFLVGILTFFIPAVSEYLKNPSWTGQVTYLGLAGLFFIAAASSVSAYFLFEWGLSKLGVIKADLFQYIEPIVATTLAVILLNEKLRFSFVIGALLIALGVYWATLAKESHKHHKAHRN